jgi:hypothetical protein
LWSGSIHSSLNFSDKTGRPHPILHRGAPIAELI